MRIVAAALLLASAAVPAFAQDSHPSMVTGASQVKWAPAPPVLPKGALFAVVSGDPSKAGPFTIRLKMPANYKVAAHHHSMAENVTVLSGSFHAGMGDRLDMKKGMAFGPGGFASIPAGMNHYAWTTKDTVIQVHGEGPFDMQYVNPADDPSKPTS
jgi:hypothetical protein